MDTIFTGHHLIHLPTVDSTNNYIAKSLQHDDLPHGTVIMAEEQTAGKGQRGSEWHSHGGLNLTCSVYYECTFLQAKEHFYLNLIACLAVRDLLDSYGLDSVVKWPNDVLIEGAKVAGILIECSMRGEMINHCVIGIGLNVNQLGFPATINATSIYAQTGKKEDVELCMERFCEYLERRYLSLQAGDFPAIKSEFESRMLGKSATLWFTSKGRSFAGEVVGINEVGRLLVKDAESVKAYDLKEIKFPL